MMLTGLVSMSFEGDRRFSGGVGGPAALTEVVLQVESLLRYQYYICHTSQRSGEIHYLTPRAS